jgi:hypothetical protein
MILHIARLSQNVIVFLNPHRLKATEWLGAMRLVGAGLSADSVSSKFLLLTKAVDRSVDTVLWDGFAFFKLLTVGLVLISSTICVVHSIWGVIHEVVYSSQPIS